MDIVNILSYAAIILTIGLFLTGLSVVSKIKRARSSSSISPTPYLAAVVNSCIWLKYGLLTQDHTILLVNGIGLILNSYYVVVCYCYAKDERWFHIPLIITSLAMFGPLIFVKFFIDSYTMATSVIGYCGCVTVTIMFGSPLSTLRRVVQTKSTESMVFSLCVMNFVVSVTWALYGYTIGDLFVQVRANSNLPPPKKAT